jgi:hypothetical protein
VAIAFAYASFLFYVAPIRMASGSERPLYRYVYRAGPVLSIVLLVLLGAVGGIFVLIWIAIALCIAMLFRRIVNSRDA